MSETICARAAALEEALWQETLNEEQARDLKRHAETCEACAQILAGVDRARYGLRTLRDEKIAVPPVEDAWQAISLRLDKKPGFSWGRSRWISSAAAVGFVAVTILSTFVALGGPMRNMFSNAAGQNQATLFEGSSVDDISPGVSAAAAPEAPGLAQHKAAGSDRLEASVPNQNERVANATTSDMQPATPPRTERSASITMGVDDARDAFKRLTGAVSEAGGRVITSHVTQQQGARRAEARLTLKIPVARCDGFIADIHGLGRVLAEEIQGEDRTVAYADVEGMLRDKDAAIDALRQRLAHGALARGEAQNIDAELVRLRRERDAMETSRRDMANRTDFSTLNVILREEESEPGAVTLFIDRFLSPLENAFGVAAGLFSDGLSVIVIALGACLPWAALGWLVWRKVRRRAFAW